MGSAIPAELVTPVVTTADPVATAVVINIAEAVCTNAAARTVARIAATLATGGVLSTAPALSAALTPPRITVPTPPSPIAVAIVAVTSFPLATLANVRTALRVPAATFSRKTAPFGEYVIFLRQAQINPSKRHQCYSGSRQILQSRSRWQRPTTVPDA
jgi:hypothetical protein